MTTTKPQASEAERPLTPRNQSIKFLAWFGFVASIGLCLFNFATNLSIGRILVGANDNNFVAVSMPLIIALLTVCFNGLFAFYFLMDMRLGSRYVPLTV